MILKAEKRTALKMGKPELNPSVFLNYLWAAMAHGACNQNARAIAERQSNPSRG